MGHSKGILRGKFIVMSAYIKRTERSQINDLMLHLKLEEEEQAKPKTSTRKEIIKIRAEINEIETNKQTKPCKQSTKPKAVSLKKINKIDRPLSILTKMRREKTQLRKIRKGDNNKHHGNPENI
jgi:hypothetical protein